jgi:hypothetical protein
MSDRSSMTELSNDARAILDAGRDADGARDLERARVRRALIAKIAIGGGATLAASSTAAASGTTVATSVATSGAVAGSVAATGSAAVGTSVAVGFPLAKILVPLAIMFSAGVGGTVAWRSQQHAVAPVVVAAPVVAPSAPVLAPVVAPSAPVLAPVVAPSAPVLPVRAVHHVHVAAPARVETPTNRLAEETALLAASNAELRGGDAHRALSLLDDYDRRYPGGVLREEVLATRVIARCQMGLTPDATSRQAADLFLRRHPASPLAPRVRSSCGH